MTRMMTKNIKTPNKRRLLAEWENPVKILVALPAPHTDWNYILKEAKEQFNDLISILEGAGESIMIVADIPYNDTWTRDYGPISVEEDGNFLELDFGFNGWGLKFAADKDNLVNLHLTEKGERDLKKYVNYRDYVLEGGSIETDGKGTILTTTRCLCSPNRNGGKSKDEIEGVLKKRLGAEKIIWLDYGFLEGDDTDSHIDTLARMAPDDTIIYVAPPEDQEDVHHQELSLMERQLKETGFRLIPLPFPDPVFDEEGNRLPATYANYLVTGKNLFIPIYGQPLNDANAIRQISSAFPLHRVFTVDCRTLIKQHGSLHCSTMQLYY